jgi:hypothetical protein
VEITLDTNVTVAVDGAPVATRRSSDFENQRGLRWAAAGSPSPSLTRAQWWTGCPAGDEVDERVTVRVDVELDNGSADVHAGALVASADLDTADATRACSADREGSLRLLARDQAGRHVVDGRTDSSGSRDAY